MQKDGYVTMVVITRRKTVKSRDEELRNSFHRCLVLRVVVTRSFRRLVTNGDDDGRGGGGVGEHDDGESIEVVEEVILSVNNVHLINSIC